MSHGTITLGVTQPATGADASTFAGWAQGVTARVDAANAAGGVRGFKIKTVVLDDQSSAQTQTSDAQNLVENDHALAIIDPALPNGMYNYLKAQQVPVFGEDLAQNYGTDKNAFGVPSSALDVTHVTTAYAVYLKKLGVTKLAVLSHSDPGSSANADAVAYTAKQAGISVVYQNQSIPFTSFDATADVLKIKQSGANGLYAPISAGASISIAQAAQAQGLHLKVLLLLSTDDPTVLAQAGSALDGTNAASVTNTPVQANLPAVQTYLANIAKYEPGAVEHPYLMAGYIAADAALYGIAHETACPSRSDLIDTMRSVTNYNAGGLITPAESFAAGQVPGIAYGAPATCQWFGVIENGKFVPDPQTTCGSLTSAGS